MDRGKVLNLQILLDHGPSQVRADAVDIIDHAIHDADPYLATKELIRQEGSYLIIGTLQYDLRQWSNIYVLGAGKATQGIALALEEILGDRLTDGIVVLKKGEPNHLEKIHVIYASHPVPDENSLRGARELMELAHKARENDIVISAITGGSSALAVLPPEGVSLADKQILNELLLASGASIHEINAVRKHVSQFKGGRLALEVFPAELIVLTVSDVIGDALDYITDPTVPDTSNYLDAWRTLDKYKLWDQLPPSINRYLRRGIETETPKSFEKSYYPFILVPGDAAFISAINRCKELGYETSVILKEIEGESFLEARKMAELALNKLKEDGHRKRFAWIGRGETVVTLDKPSGVGGPNQEFALSAALAVQGQKEIVVASIDMDGTDGPTDFSGAIVDGDTINRARENSLDPRVFLKKHCSTDLLKVTKDLVYTGSTGTNVNDLMFVLVDLNPDQIVS